MCEFRILSSNFCVCVFLGGFFGSQLVKAKRYICLTALCSFMNIVQNTNLGIFAKLKSHFDFGTKAYKKSQ